MTVEWELLLRLAIAALLGAALGLEREARNRSAGLRTHALVAMGAAMFTLAGAYGFTDVPHGPNVDPARVAAQVASGIGFIGAGAIIKDGATARGLTTAATLWLAASLGMAAAAGLYVIAAIGLAIVLVVLVLFRRFRPEAHRLGRLLSALEGGDRVRKHHPPARARPVRRPGLRERRRQLPGRAPDVFGGDGGREPR